MGKNEQAASSAATTAFCTEKLTSGLDHLWVDGNQKITAGNGSFNNPLPNAFSTVQIQDCPGSTPTCRESCYVHGLEKHAPETHDRYKHNSATIRKILERPEKNRDEWVQTFADWIDENAQGGFRWHVSGDVFSLKYATFIRDVCLAVPGVKFWIYTRTFQYAHVMQKASNLIVNLSADKDNYDQARQVADQESYRVCYLSSEGEVPAGLVEGDVIFPDYSLRGSKLDSPTEHTWWQGLSKFHRKMVCPVDFFGKSETSRCGVCTKCME